MTVDRALAQRQWERLVATLRDAGAEIELLEPQPGLPDLVFTANLGLVDGDTFIPARMRHAERRDEPAHAERWFRAHGYDDPPPRRGRRAGGRRRRAAVRGHARRRLPHALVGILVRRPRADRRRRGSCPSSSSTSASTTSTSSSARWTRAARCWLPASSTPTARGSCASSCPIRSSLTDEEAQAFSANAVVVGRTVVMPACSPRLERELRSRGFEPVVVDVSEFLKAGGGPALPDARARRRARCARGHRRARASATSPTTTTRCAVTVTDAEGAWVRDDRGRRYLDALARLQRAELRPPPPAPRRRRAGSSSSA